MDKKKKNTLLLIAAVAVILGVLALVQSRPKEKGMVAVIQQEGRILETVRLDKERDFIVQHPTGGFNAVRVQDGKICVTDADCPDQTCVRTGNAWEEGQVIACLPHRLIIYIEQEKD